MKTCNRCQIPKPLSDFHRCSNSSDGHHTLCKMCRQKHMHKYNRTERGREVQRTHAKTEKGKASHRRYRNSPKGRINKANVRERFYSKPSKKLHMKNYKKVYNKNYKKTHQEQTRVYAIVQRAIKKGILPPPTTCAQENEFCNDRFEYHHPDYSKPLDVIPLCNFHHQLLHKS